MRRAAGSQLRGLRLAGELLAAEASTSGRGAATGAAACAGAGSGGSLVAAWCSAAARTCGLHHASPAQRRLVSTACARALQGGGAGCAALQRVASCAGATASGRGLAPGLLPARSRGLHLAPASRWLRQPAPGWQTAAAGGAKPLPRPRLRAEFGTRASRRGRGGTGLPPAAAAAAAAAAGWAGGAYLPSRWAAARRQLAQRLEWVLGRGYHAREAFFNAVYMQVRLCQHGM